jgi:hypothetical protein
MSDDLDRWLDEATRGLPPAVRGRARQELATHHAAGTARYLAAGHPAATAHRLALADLGPAATTARAFRAARRAGRSPAWWRGVAWPPGAG